MQMAILVVTAAMAFDPIVDREMQALEGGSQVVRPVAPMRVQFAGREYIVHDAAAVRQLSSLLGTRRSEKKLSALMPKLIARGVARPAKPY